MDILQKHTAKYFGAMQHGINRSGKVIYTAKLRYTDKNTPKGVNDYEVQNH